MVEVFGRHSDVEVVDRAGVGLRVLPADAAPERLGEERIRLFGRARAGEETHRVGLPVRVVGAAIVASLSTDGRLKERHVCFSPPSFASPVLHSEPSQYDLRLLYIMN